MEKTKKPTINILRQTQKIRLLLCQSSKGVMARVGLCPHHLATPLFDQNPLSLATNPKYRIKTTKRENTNKSMKQPRNPRILGKCLRGG